MKYDVILRPAISGQVNYKDLFPGLLTRIDESFSKFIEDGNLGENFSAVEREYYLFQTDEAFGSDTEIINKFNINELMTPDELMADLNYLNEEGSKLLDIPEGEVEVNLILGYINDIETGGRLVIFVEHEYKAKDGREEIHFHCRPLDSWTSEKLKGFAKKSK